MKKGGEQSGINEWDPTWYVAYWMGPDVPVYPLPIWPDDESDTTCRLIPGDKKFSWASFEPKYSDQDAAARAARRAAFKAKTEAARMQGAQTMINLQKIAANAATKREQQAEEERACNDAIAAVRAARAAKRGGRRRSSKRKASRRHRSRRRRSG